MSRFSHLSTLDVPSTLTARCVLYQIKGEPYLLVKPATESNKPFFNEQLKRARRVARAVGSGAITAKIVGDNRDDDRRLFPKYIIEGWGGVNDTQGNPVPYSQEACSEFLAALPDWLFDQVREFAGNNANFLGDDGESLADGNELGKS